ncbi:unnamed protein product [Callosobruchus maculatus]|nr:unnamed protein product [Callosobruchus maculatus]
MPNQDAVERAVARDGPKWSLYIKGVVAKYLGGSPPAFTAVVHSSVPLGGGLSSSASLEVATYVFLDALTGDTSVSMTDKVLACQKAENEYAEMPCGIMDQYISFMGKEGHALLIDCRSMTSTLIPVADENVVFLVINSNVKHELTSSEFHTRRKQCEEAARILKKASLRDANLEDIQHLQCIDTDEVIVRRARHVITERHRTVEGAEMLKQRNYDKFGLLMKESHLSLKEDFEVSCPELDELVALALEVDGVLGSRMTGAGFGGCTVSLVCTHAVDNMIDHIKKNYKGNATFYICKPGPGASRI